MAPQSYTRAAKWLHWGTVPLLAVVLLSGPVIRFIVEEAKLAFYTVHESLGLLVLSLGVARLWHRWRHPPPVLPASLSGFERVAAHTVHVMLSLALVAQPTLGFLTTNAYGFPQQGPTAFLGIIDLPAFMDAAPDLARRLHVAHAALGWATIVLVLLHVCGVVHRHVIRGDDVLGRMT